MTQKCSSNRKGWFLKLVFYTFSEHYVVKCQIPSEFNKILIQLFTKIIFLMSYPTTKTKIIISRENAIRCSGGVLEYFRSHFNKAYERSGRIITAFNHESVKYHKRDTIILCVDETNSIIAKKLNKIQITWCKFHHWNEVAIDVFRFLEDSQGTA